MGILYLCNMYEDLMKDELLTFLIGVLAGMTISVALVVGSSAFHNERERACLEQCSECLKAAK